jgi:hypothetical protein
MKNAPWKHNTVTETPKEQPGRKKQHTLTILLSALTSLALLHFIAAVHSAYPTIVVNTCDKAIRNANYTQYVSLTKGQSMLAVQFTNELTAGQPSAMVQVTDTSAQHLLDVYMYGCSMQQHGPLLTLLFKQQELVRGTASITQAHTLSIGQLDTTLAANRNGFLLPLQENVYREYIWQDGAFKQTLFPGLYPVISRSEAEALQEQADYAQDMPWRDLQATAEQMAQDLLKWPTNSLHSIILDTHASTAHILLIQTQPHMEVTVSLAKLVQTDANGLWFVTGAQTEGITLNQAKTYKTYTTNVPPMTIQGTMREKSDHIVTTLFDHTITPINVLNTASVHIQPNGNFAGNISYSNPFPNQPGLLLIEAFPPASRQKQMKQKEVGHTIKQDLGQLLLTNTILD